MKKLLITIVTILFTILVLSLGVKGQSGNPIYFQTEKNKMVTGPFESSNSTSRYALVESIVENRSLTFTEEQAQFAAPDLVSSNGKLFSIFTPGVSFVGVPFYMLGKLFGTPQLFTYFSTIIFALLNVVMLIILGRKLGVHLYEALIGSLIFLFGTNALSYAFSFTQHHMSTTFILLGLLNALSKRTFLNNVLFGVIYGAGLLVDIPNGIMMLPLVLYVLFKHLSVTEFGQKIKLSLKLNGIGLLIGLSVLLSVFGWYNNATTGSHTALAQAIGRADFTKSGAVERIEESKHASIYDHGGVYDTRPQLNGLYILLFSDERGWIFYSPILVLGILGFIKAYQNKEHKILILLASSISLVCLVTYASFGDPWGGWSFGARYLMPAGALVSLGIGSAMQAYKRNSFFIFIFFVLLIYSVSINTLGALTTSAIPPKVEAIHLLEPIPYTYAYNWEFIQKGLSSSLLYNIFLYKYLSLKNYLYSYSGVTIVMIGSLFGLACMTKVTTKKI